MAKGLILPALLLAAVPNAVAAQEARQIDLKKPARPVPGPGEAMIVLRAWADGMVGDNHILVHRIDPATGAILRDAKGRPQGVRLSYSHTVFGGKKGERALRVAILPAGDHVLAGRVFNGSFTDSFCFGAPRFALKAGEVVYIGDYQMHALARMPDGERRNAMGFGSELEGARTALAGVYPVLAPALTAWAPANGATFGCEGDEFTAYAVPGVTAVVER